jgi:hypothetical protein
MRHEFVQILLALIIVGIIIFLVSVFLGAAP